MPSLVSYVGFSLLWLIIVLAAFNALLLPALLMLGLWLALHLYYSRDWAVDVWNALITLCIGPLSDTLAMHGGLLGYLGSAPGDLLPPAWIFAHWLNFSLLLNHGLDDFRDRPWLLALIGAIAGPSVYLAGEALGVVTVQAPRAEHLTLLALSWTILLPLLMSLCQLAHNSESPQNA